MKTAAILGCGYVGQAIARYWQAKGITVTATTTRPERLGELEAVAQHVKVARGDDAAQLSDLLKGQTTLLVSVGAPHPDAYAETYLATAKTVAQVVDQHPQLTQIIYTGSYAVYGDRQGNWIDETADIAPVNDKGHVLAETEQILLNLATAQRQVCVFRLGGIYGPGRELVNIFRRAAGTTRPGTGTDASNWVHLDDIVGAIAFARDHHLNGIYNLVQDDPPTVKALLDRVCAANGLAPIEWDASQPSARPYNARVSNAKLKAAGYEFQHPLFSQQLI
jgi:nucleoside-diphosphate-sugar epimerase